LVHLPVPSTLTALLSIVLTLGAIKLDNPGLRLVTAVLIVVPPGLAGPPLGPAAGPCRITCGKTLPWRDT